MQIRFCLCCTCSFSLLHPERCIFSLTKLSNLLYAVVDVRTIFHLQHGLDAAVKPWLINCLYSARIKYISYNLLQQHTISGSPFFESLANRKLPLCSPDVSVVFWDWPKSAAKCVNDQKERWCTFEPGIQVYKIPSEICYSPWSRGFLALRSMCSKTSFP